MAQHYNQRGQLLIELLVALGVSAILIPAITTGFIASRQGQAQQRQRLEATALAREAGDAVRVLRDANWSNISASGTYHPEVSGATWVLASGAETIRGYTRSIVIADTLRDGNGVIVATGGTFDPSTKHVLVAVSWGTPVASTVTSAFYLTRITSNAWVQTTQEDFDAGTLTSVVTTNTSGGEVTLGAGGSGRADWCAPNLSIAATDLPKSGVANAVSAIEGKLFAGTGDNASGVSYATVLIDNLNPPHATVSGTFDGYKTSDIFGEASYAYLATDNNFREIEIINLATNPYAEAGYFDAPGNGDGDSVFVSGNIGYMTSGSNFYTFDLTSKAGSRPALGTTTLVGTGKKIVVVGTYAYVAVDSPTTQLQILDVTNPASPAVVGQAQLTAGVGVDVFVTQSATRAYLATAASATYPELFILDITTKTGDHAVTGSYEANGMNPKGVTVVTGNRALLVGVGGEEYQAINITNESVPARCGGLHVNAGINGIASVLEADGEAYSYIITGDATSELKIIEGGPGGTFARTGTFESSTLDATMSSAFNRFVANGVLPPGTTLEYQVSGADAVAGTCAGVTFTYVGPDGTAATRFATSSAIPLSGGPGYKNPAQCFRYKVYLTTSDATAAPIFTDFTLNYSP